MIEATCIACGKLLGSFANQAEYIEWREKNSMCACGASLVATLFTSYTKVEKIKSDEEETKPLEEQPRKARSRGILGDVFRARRK
jgi:hypothetical protein